MADNTTRNQIPAEVNNFYDRTLLERAVPLFVHQKWAQIRDIPRNSGTNTVKFRRYSNLSAATTPLNEGVTPQGKQLSTTEITATTSIYGDYVTITDKVEMETEDPILTETAEILGDQAGDTLDQLTRDVLVAGTNVQYADTGGDGNSSTSDVASDDKIDSTEVKKAVRTLKNNKARRITRMVEPSTGVASQPINQAYIGICHPDTTYTLKSDGSFVSVEKYSSQMTTMEGEVGKLDEVRFVETPNAKILVDEGNSNQDVYPTIILGQNAYGTTRISGESLENIVKPFGSAGTADPLNQRTTSGWKATFVSKILNNDFMIRLEHATDFDS